MEKAELRTKEYGMSLFHDIEYNPVFTYKPFTPGKCTRTYIEHYRRIVYRMRMQCYQCLERRRGCGPVDDICHCE